MELKLDTSKTYAFALEGGGARGAYQAGAWKAFEENGIKYSAVSGTSVGALNGAMMAMKNPALSEEIWNNMDFSRVIKVDGRLMKTVFDKGILELEVKNIKSSLKTLFRDKGFDASPLKALIKEKIDPVAIKNSDVRLFISTYSITDRKGLDLEASLLGNDELCDMLMASAYFPVFKNDMLGGKRYTDGGVSNLIPISPLVKEGYTDIIAIRLGSLGVEKRVKIPEGTTVTELIPKTDLGSLMNFSKNHCRKLFKLGYFDALRLLFGLYGEKYYIDRTLSEEEAFEILFKISNEQLDDKLSLRQKHKSFLRFCREYDSKGDYYDVLVAYLEGEAEKANIPIFSVVLDRDLLNLLGLGGYYG